MQRLMRLQWTICNNMEALTCPKCSAPLQHGMNSCPYCRVGLTGMPGTNTSVPPPLNTGPRTPPLQIPEGWIQYEDPWHGFQLAHPVGWEVSTLQGQTTIKADPIGFTSAGILPFANPTPTTARSVAQQFVSLASKLMQNFQAWQQGSAAADSNRITIRTRGMRFGQTLEGIYNILVDGQNCIISGYSAPPQNLMQQGPLMTQILATFRTTGQPMARQPAFEPQERAFSIQIPSGWIFRGGVNRNNIGGAGSLQFSVGRDPQGSAMVSMPSFTWMFTQPVMSFFAFPTGVPSLPFMPASQFVQQVVMGQYRQMHPDVQIVRVMERPDLSELSQWELARSGYPLGTFETSIAMLEAVYSEQGVRYLEKSKVGVMRQPGQPMWNALIDMMYRAPEAEMRTLEPVLTGCYWTLQINPQWQAGERSLAQNYINNSQADIHRRQAQISQTLSETSDIISSSYWNRQASYDRISEMRSNATLGVQNVASDSGEIYKVPFGYDQYWRDGLGNVFAGSWLTQPEINWQPLTPTGI